MLKAEADVLCLPLSTVFTPYGCLYLQFADTPECEECTNPVTIAVRPVFQKDVTVVPVKKEDVLIKEEEKTKRKRKPKGWDKMSPSVRRAYMGG